MKLYKLFIALPVICIAFAFIQKESTDSPVQPGAKLEKVADGFLFTEGPSPDTKGNIYFTDQPNNRIMKWSAEGGLSTFLQPCGHANGTAFDKEGNLWVCADEKGELWKIAPDKTVTVVVGKYQDKIFNGPNDVWIDNKGGMYISDPFWKRDYWAQDHTGMTQDIQAVYYLAPDHKTLTRVISDFMVPNGVVGTPDGKTLFVADMGARKTWSYTINKDGSLSNKKLFCEMGSDGIALDTKGNIYITGRGITIFNKSGVKIGFIEVPEGTANVCFGDTDMKSLYITARKGLYKIRLSVKGTRG
jgi:gluconolactonase